MPFAVESIDHVEVFVRSIPEAIRWYGEVLGLKEVQRWDPEPVMIGAGRTKLALFQAPSGAKATPEKESPPLRWHRVAWLTDGAGFAAAQEHLTALGIPFRGPIDHKPTRSIYFHDPDGHPLEITTLHGV
jgi:catechol 2,3-dioxygenase-like lactoylglutathione lyase family enzyme